MDVRSEPGAMPGREPFSVGMQKTPVTVQPTHPPPSPTSTVPPNMRLAYTSDGTAVYKPINTSSLPPHQGAGGRPGGTGAPGGSNGSAQTTVLPGGTAPPGGSNGPLQATVQHGVNMNMGEPLKRKRGRPRKYGPDGSMALSLTPASHAATVQQGAAGFTPSSTVAAPMSPASGDAMKKAKGRPPGSAKKQQMAALGSGGIGFTPHVITVQAGEDVSSKVMSFSQHGPRAVCILSANGAISNVTLRQAATSGGTVTYEGRFEILSLSGSSLLSESGGQRSRTGGLSVSLAGPDGRVLGGGVAGQLMAATPVQVVVGSFLADGKKEQKPTSPSDPIPAPGIVAASGVTVAPSSPSSRGTQSESSGGGPGSPLNLTTGFCNSSNQEDILSKPWK